MEKQLLARNINAQSLLNMMDISISCCR